MNREASERSKQLVEAKRARAVERSGRQREAAAAREKLALIDDEPAAPNRNPPTVEDALVAAAIASAHAAE